RLSASSFNLDEGAFTDAGTVFASDLAPFPPAIDQFGPIGEDAALCGLGGVNGAAFSGQEIAGGIPWNAPSRPVFSVKHIAFLEFTRRHAEEGRCTFDIRIGYVDETLLTAAGGAAWLAFEPESFGHVSL